MNNFDKLLGRNGELVELRKEQVLAGALEIVQQYYADKQNKMEAVAQLFGKHLNEEFDVRFNGKLKCLQFDAQRGLLYFDGNEWRKNYAYLDWLIRGKAVIVDE